MDTRVARPTEYKGLLFRSKCEAIFARNLDLVGALWEYEPPEFKLSDGWVPDFKIAFLCTACKPPHVEWLLAEYKPSEPTPTYLNELYGRFACLGTQEKCVVIIGSPFNKHRKVLTWVNKADEWRESQSARLMMRLDEAARYRFDLLEGGN